MPKKFGAMALGVNIEVGIWCYKPKVYSHRSG